MHLSNLKFAFIVCCLAVSLAACGGSRSGANQSASDQSASNGNAANTNGLQTGLLDMAKLDAEINQLEAQAAQSPDDNSVREAVANAYVRRGAANYDAHKLPEALRDYQSALSYNPAHEDAQLRVEQISQEISGGVRADDGKPVTVPAKPGASNSNQ
ncbi:MAG: tetratricopeptide repeat protein [Pyrinomonadaceae bacterium]